LVPVPLQFPSVKSWAELLGHNLLAEFWEMYRESKGRGATMDAVALDGGRVRLHASTSALEEGLQHHLLLVGGKSLHLVMGQDPPDLIAGTVGLNLKPCVGERGRFRCKSLGYIGSYVAELGALMELAILNATEQRAFPVLQSILRPAVDVPGDYNRDSCFNRHVPINPSQKETVMGLRDALEKVQGPPGTGKSTTIYHMITARLPPGTRVLVTCSRNVAVESIAQKLEPCTQDRMLVVGNPKRIGETARNHLLGAKAERHPKARGAFRHRDWLLHSEVTNPNAL